MEGQCRRSSRPALGAMVAAVTMAASTLDTRADEVAEFYKGKTLTIMVGHETGTTFDTYARVLARHYHRHIPGTPSILVQNMPGASGINALNWLYAIAAKNGTVISTFTQSSIVEPLLGNAAAKYDPNKFVWIGNMEQSAPLCAATTAAGIAGFDDLLTREVIWGATAPNGPFSKSALALNYLIGTKLKIITGYRGSSSLKLAVEKGEVHGVCGMSHSTFKASWTDMLDRGQLKLIIQLYGRPLPELPGIAHLDAYLKTAEQRQIVDLVYGLQLLGRIFAAPPGTTVARTNALRTAFDAAMKDDELLAEAIRTRIDIIPDTGAEVERTIKGFYQSSPAIVEKARQATEPK